MKYKTHNDINIDIDYTSYKGVINLDFYDILDKLGKPLHEENYKTDAEWVIEFEGGVVCTLYNWKNGKNYLGEKGLNLHQITEWNVGGKTMDAYYNIIKLFKG